MQCLHASWISQSVGILDPFSPNIGVEAAREALDMGSDDTFKAVLIVLVHDFVLLAIKEEIGLKLKSSGQFMSKNNLPDFEHLLIDLRVVIEECLGCFVVAHRLVAMELVQKGGQCLIGGGPELGPVNLHLEIVFTVLFKEIECDGRGISFSDGLEDHP